MGALIHLQRPGALLAQKPAKRVAVVDWLAVPYRFAGRHNEEPLVLVHGLAGEEVSSAVG